MARNGVPVLQSARENITRRTVCALRTRVCVYVCVCVCVCVCETHKMGGCTIR